MSNIRNVDLNLLIVLDALLDERSVSRAARRLNLSQPAVSGALKRLRATFNDPLFIRSQQGVRPTARALELTGPVKTVLQDIDKMLSTAEFRPETAEAVFTIAATDYAQMTFLAPLIMELHRRAPGIRFAIVPTDTRTMPDQFERQEIDFAITVPEMAPERTSAYELFADRYVCAVRRDHPWADETLTLDGFCALDHILVTPSSDGFHGPTDDALALLRRERRVVVSVPTFLSLPSILQNSDFIAVAPERVLVPFAHALSIFPAPFEIPEFVMIALWNEHAGRSPAHQWILARMKEIAGRMRAADATAAWDPGRKVLTAP